MNKLAVREIVQGKGGFVCRVEWFGDTFAIFVYEGTEAMVILKAGIGRKIIAGKSYPEFSDELQDKRPEKGTQVIAYVEEVEGCFFVTAWGLYSELLTAEQDVKFGRTSVRNSSDGESRLNHMERRAPRRFPQVSRRPAQGKAGEKPLVSVGAVLVEAQVSAATD